MLSKNTVSPRQPATMTDEVRRKKSQAVIARKGAMPAVASTQASSSTPPPVARMALTVAELKLPARRRTSRLTTAQVPAERSAHAAPTLDSEMALIDRLLP